MGLDGLCRWVEGEKVALGVFFPSGWDLTDCVGGLGGDKVALGVFFSSGWDLMDCVVGLSGINWS